MKANSNIVFGDTISKTIYFFKDNIRLSDEYIEKEIKNANKILFDWANKLPKTFVKSDK